MKSKSVILISLFILIFTSGAFAEIPTTSIKAEASKTKITTDDSLTYKIIISSNEKRLPVPGVPKFAGFTVVSQAQSSNLSLAQGELKTTLVYAFVLVPNHIGKFNIPPASIKIGDQVHSSASIEIEVIDKPSLPQEPQIQSDQPQITL